VPHEAPLAPRGPRRRAPNKLAPEVEDRRRVVRLQLACSSCFESLTPGGLMRTTQYRVGPRRARAQRRRGRPRSPPPRPAPPRRTRFSAAASGSGTPPAAAAPTRRGRAGSDCGESRGLHSAAGPTFAAALFTWLACKRTYTAGPCGRRRDGTCSGGAPRQLGRVRVQAAMQPTRRPWHRGSVAIWPVTSAFHSAPGGWEAILASRHRPLCKPWAACDGGAQRGRVTYTCELTDSDFARVASLESVIRAAATATPGKRALDTFCDTHKA
jgi:hypothetical protein